MPVRVCLSVLVLDKPRFAKMFNNEELILELSDVTLTQILTKGRQGEGQSKWDYYERSV